MPCTLGCWIPAVIQAVVSEGPGEAEREDELHDHYSPAARCRSKLRFWVSLKVAYVFICEECRGMRTLSARRHPVRFFTRTSELAACRRNDFLPDR